MYASWKWTRRTELDGSIGWNSVSASYTWICIMRTKTQIRIDILNRWLYSSCLECEICQINHTACPKQRNAGAVSSEISYGTSTCQMDTFRYLLEWPWLGVRHTDKWRRTMKTSKADFANINCLIPERPRYLSAYVQVPESIVDFCNDMFT